MNLNSNTPYLNFIAANEEMASYFNALPQSVQSVIIHSAGDIKTVSELKKIAEGLMKK